MSRLSCLMAEGEAVTDTAVLCRNRDLRPEAVAPLFRKQIGFRYLPESLLPECSVRDRVLSCRGHVFHTVIGGDEFGLPVPEGSHSAPDLKCDPPAPALRTARLKYEDGECWFLVNAEDQTIRTEVTLPTHLPIGCFDLWRGEARQCPSADTPEGKRLSLRLMPRESTLLFACRDEDAFQALPPPGEEGMELKADFSLIREDPDRMRKIYAAVVRGEGRDAVLHLQAEEMAELEVGGQFVDAAFWSPQVFSIPASMLPKGREVQLLLTVTGSPANRYGHPVPYGLELQEQ